MSGIIISSSVGWAASGKVDIIGPRILVPLEFAMPLKRRLPEPNAAQGTQVILTEVVLPGGNNLPTTVNPSDVPLGEFKEFPFRPLVVVPPLVEVVALVATFAQGSNSRQTPSQPAVVPGIEVTVKSAGQTIESVKLSIEWIWRIKCAGPELGATNDLVVPLMLDEGSDDGWETPVTLELKLPNGHVLVTRIVEPKDIPVGVYKEFILSMPERPKELELTVTTKQTRGPGSTLLVGDVTYIPFVRK